MKRERQAGFTLVELLTVIAIIALLTALVLGLAGVAQKTAARKKAESEVAQLTTVITDYQMQYGQVPADTEALTNYLVIISHPLTNMIDPWGMSYAYSNISRQLYYLGSYGGDLDKTNKGVFIGNPPPK